MAMLRGSIVLYLLGIFIPSIHASQCPEPRKPHVTSCTIFYNCINLPQGGYVWAPAKCAQGLVFQPYLRICVLPGDTWTCDTLATESPSIVERLERPGSIDPAITSYLGYTQESSPFTVHSRIETSYPVEDFGDLSNVGGVVTPYPLIEVSNADVMNINDHKVKEGIPQSIEHRMENYLYQFFNRHEKLGIAGQIKGQDNHSTWLNGFINKMLLYENVSGPWKYQEFGTDPSSTQITTTCKPNRQGSLKKNEYVDDANNDMWNYIVQSYILKRKDLEGKLKKKSVQAMVTSEPKEIIEQNGEDSDSMTESSGDNPIDLFGDGSKTENKIVAIRGNLGGKEYITVDKYRALSKDVPVEVVEILPCAKGIRLPNRTDCTKYYTCDPETATLVAFSCSSKTAFNDYNRVCEIQKYKACSRQLNESAMVKSSTSEAPINVSVAREEVQVKKNPCQTTGKFVDPESDRNYFVCYSNQKESGEIDSIIMTCPNNLIFCQESRLCTTRKRCYD